MKVERYSRTEVVTLLGVSEDFLLTLERDALVAPDAEGRYERRTLERVRICWSLQHELGVNPAGTEVCLHLLERLERERRQFRDVLAWLQGELRESGGG